MYERLLVAIDHSEATARVLEAARNLASLSQAEVWVLHLREREVLPRAGVIPTESKDQAKAEVEAAVEELLKTGINARGEVRDTVYGYAARVVSPGTYRWEPAILQFELDPRIGASTEATTFTIR